MNLGGKFPGEILKAGAGFCKKGENAQTRETLNLLRVRKDLLLGSWRKMYVIARQMKEKISNWPICLAGLPGSRHFPCAKYDPERCKRKGD